MEGRVACPIARQFTGGLQSIKPNKFNVLKLFCTIGVDAAKRGVIASLFTLRALVARVVGESFPPSSPRAMPLEGAGNPSWWLARLGGPRVGETEEGAPIGIADRESDREFSTACGKLVNYV